MKLENITFKSPFNNSNILYSQPIEKRPISAKYFEDNFEKQKTEEPDLISKGAKWGSLTGFVYSLFNTFDNHKILNNFEKYKTRAIKTAKIYDADLSKLTDSLLKKEILEAKTAQKYMIPINIAFLTGLGLLLGIGGGSVASAFKKES
jgi:hypothetical protein